jgi:hypothetical protein
MTSNVTFNLAINALEGREPDLPGVIARLHRRIDQLETSLCPTCSDTDAHQQMVREVEVLTSTAILIDLLTEPAIAQNSYFQTVVADVVANVRDYLTN